MRHLFWQTPSVVVVAVVVVVVVVVVNVVIVVAVTVVVVGECGRGEEGKEGREAGKVTNNKTHWDTLDPEAIRDPHDTRQEGAEDTRGVGKMKKLACTPRTRRGRKGGNPGAGVSAGVCGRGPPSCRPPARRHAANTWRGNRTRPDKAERGKQREAQNCLGLWIWALTCCHRAHAVICTKQCLGLMLIWIWLWVGNLDLSRIRLASTRNWIGKDLLWVNWHITTYISMYGCHLQALWETPVT